MSASGPSQRLLKRKCTDIEKEHTLPQGNPTSASRSTTLWFDDGTIILEVQNTQFRVHRTFLSSNSAMFNDMFKIPQPESEALVEGCAVVRMNDEVEDWENLLNAMYFLMKIQPLGKDPSTRHLISTLRLGKKYQFDNIYNAALTRLKAELPPTLVEFQKIFEARGYFEWDPSPDGTIATLSQNPFFIRIILSRDQVRANSIKYGLNWIFGVHRVIPVPGCEDFWGCFDSCIRMIKDIDADSSSFLGYSFLPPGAFPFDEFCGDCTEAKDKSSSNPRELWNQLPSCFGFPKWEDLLKSDLPS